MPVALVVSLALPMVALAETEPPPDRRAFIQVGATAPVYAGHPFTEAGRLVTPVERVSPTSTLHVVRTMDGVTTALPDIITSEDGSFTLGDGYDKKGLANYRLSWDGDEEHDPASRSFWVLFRPVPVTISMQAAPASPAALGPVTISGAVVFGLGEQVSSPLTLSVIRRYSSDSSTALPPVTTDPDGTFEFTDVLHGGQWTYEVTFAGDEAHEYRNAFKSVIVRFLQVQVSVELAAGESLRWGQTSRYVGRVTALEGPPISQPLTVNVHPSGSCGGSQGGVQVQTAADGSFAADVVPGCPYDSTVTATSLYDADHASASGSSTSAAVGTGVPAVYLNADWAGDGPSSEYGRPVTFETGVRWAVGRGLFEIYAKPYAQNKVLLKRVWLTNGQGPTFTYYPKRRTVFTAVYHGDERVVAGSTSRVLWVHPNLNVMIAGCDSHIANWCVFRQRNDIGYIQSLSIPAHPGQRTRVVVQKYINASWRTVISRSLPQDRRGQVYTELKGLHGRGNKYRVRASWSGDGDHVAATSYWEYFRFTV